jgi:hypothetical protein
VHLTFLAQAIDQELDIFISVRRLAGYLNSAYFQILLGGLIRPSMNKGRTIRSAASIGSI